MDERLQKNDDDGDLKSSLFSMQFCKKNGNQL